MSSEPLIAGHRECPECQEPTFNTVNGSILGVLQPDTCYACGYRPNSGVTKRLPLEDADMDKMVRFACSSADDPKERGSIIDNLAAGYYGWHSFR